MILSNAVAIKKTIRFLLTKFYTDTKSENDKK
jgi:hypothetical protein